MRLDISFLVGVWLEALVYGTYVVAFIVCLRLFRTHAPVVGRALPIWLGALFILATTHCALSLSAALDAFIRFRFLRDGQPPPSPTPSPMPSPSPTAGAGNNPRPNSNWPYGFHDPNRYISNRAMPTNLAALGVYTGIVLLSGLMLLYRLLVMYRYRFIWIVGPALLVVGSFVISIIVVSKYAHIDLALNGAALDKELENVNPWVPPAYAIAFLSNLTITTLMMVKTSFTTKQSPKSSHPPFSSRRRHAHQNSLSAGDGYVFDIDERTGPAPTSIPGASAPTRRTISSKWLLFAGIIESGALAPIFMLAALILYVAEGGQETLLVPMLAPITALVPTLQIIQLQLGLDSAARNRPPSLVWSGTNDSERGGGNRTSGQGRSPYLVPAPRYHDSSSEDETISDTEGRFVNGRRKSSSKSRRSNSTSEPVSPTTARRFSAQFARGMWAWRGRAGSGSGSHAHSNSQSGSSARGEPPVMLQMRDMTGSAERAAQNETKAKDETDDGVWERIKLDESKTHVPATASDPKPTPPPMPARRSTLRKSGGIVKGMISKPTPIAADFPPTTANLPSTAIVPALPNFTINAETGITANSGLARSSTSVSEHKYHYRVRPREKTASSLVAYLSAQALAQAHADEQERPQQPMPLNSHPGSSVGHNQPPSFLGHNQPPSSLGHNQPPSSTGHQLPSSFGNLPSTIPMSIISTVPTSPASGFTSLNPHSASRNPFRYDAQAEQQQPHHRPSYSDLQRAEAGPEAGMAGIGLSGARRTPLTVPFSFNPDPEVDYVPRWGAVPGAPRIVGLDTFFPPGRGGARVEDIQRDVSPAPGLQRDYARAREEVLKQMQRERGGGGPGGMTDDESVYSTQMLARR